MPSGPDQDRTSEATPDKGHAARVLALAERALQETAYDIRERVRQAQEKVQSFLEAAATCKSPSELRSVPSISKGTLIELTRTSFRPDQKWEEPDDVTLEALLRDPHLAMHRYARSFSNICGCDDVAPAARALQKALATRTLIPPPELWRWVLTPSEPEFQDEWELVAHWENTILPSLKKASPSRFHAGGENDPWAVAIDRADAMELLAELITGASRPCPPATGDARSSEQDAGRRPQYGFQLVGNIWHLDFEGEYGTFGDRKGLQLIWKLLHDPNPTQAPTAMELRLQTGAVSHSAQDREDRMDPEALNAYRRRYLDLKDLIEEAKTSGAEARLSELEDERKRLADQVGKDLGLGGASRPIVDSYSEKARKALWKAVDDAVTNIEACPKPPMPKLVAHLREAIKIRKDACAYEPKSQLVWILDK